MVIALYMTWSTGLLIQTMYVPDVCEIKNKIYNGETARISQMKRKGRIKIQKLSEINGGPGAYGNWCTNHPTLHAKGKLGDKFDSITEDVRANPDSLREDEAIYSSDQPSTPQFLMGEAVEHLQGRQKEVYLLTMREGKSLAEAAEILSISKGTAQKYKERAIKFIEQYCKAAIAKGRV